MIAYWASEIEPCNAPGHPALERIQTAAPWQYCAHPYGGTLATWAGASRSHEDYAPPVDTLDGLRYLGPRQIPTIYDLARDGGQPGVDVRLACGAIVTIPVATVAHRQLRLGRRVGIEGVIGDPVSSYGRLAVELSRRAAESSGLSYEDDDLHRLLLLALAQRYRVTADLLDDMALIAQEDVDPLLGAIWTGDPKALQLETAGQPSASPISG
jgi:hypothetical protein